MSHACPRRRHVLPRGRIAGIVIIAALAALSLTGCGGDARLSKSDYEQRVRSLYANVQAVFRKTNVTSTKLLPIESRKPRQS